MDFSYKTFKPFLLFTKKHKDYFAILFIYAVYYLYSVNFIPEVIIPPYGTDPFLYELAADMVKENGLLLKNCPTYFCSPFYQYFYYFIKLIPVHMITHIRIKILIQLIAFFLSTIYFRKFLSLLFKDKVSRIGMFMYALYPTYIFYSVLPIKSILAVSVMTYFIYNFFRFIEYKKIINLILAGLFLGLILNLRFNHVLLIPLFFTILIKKTSFRKIAIFALSACIFILPFTLRNYFVAKDKVLLTCISGIHLYIGNNPDATGIYITVPGIRRSSYGHYYDAKKLAESRSGKTMKDSQVNRYWKNQSFKFIRENPIKAFRLFIRKLMLTINYEGIQNNYKYGFFVKNYLPFKLFYVPIGFGLLFVTGILGLLFSDFKYRKFILCCFVIMCFAVSVIFVTGRYRLSGCIFLLIGTSGLLNEIFCKRLKINYRFVLTAIILTAITFFPIKKKYLDNDHPRRKHIRAKKQLDKYHKMGAEKFDQYFDIQKKKYFLKYTKK